MVGRTNSPEVDISMDDLTPEPPTTHSKDTMDIRTICPDTIPLKSCILISKGDGSDDRISVKKAKSVQFADTLGKPLKSVKTLAGSPDDLLFPMHILSLRSTTRRSFPVERSIFQKKDKLKDDVPSKQTDSSVCVNFANPISATDLGERVAEQKVCVERITFLNGSEIFGGIVVKNLCYEKQVEVHYTSDNWSTKRVETAKYETMSSGVKNADLFSFHLIPKLHHCIGGLTEVMFAIRYSAKGFSYWDSNGGKNYHVKLKTVAEKQNGTTVSEDKKGFLLPLQCFGSAI